MILIRTFDSFRRLSAIGSFSKNVHIWGKIFSKKFVFAFHLMLRLLRRKCIHELRKSHMQA